MEVASTHCPSKRWGIPVYANHRTSQELGLLPEFTHHFESLDVLQFSQGTSLLPVPVPHSGADNVAFVASHGGERTAIITDLGSWTDELVHHVHGCQHIAVEANYDSNRLLNGPYPRSLKDRISGRGGHLSNEQTGQFLKQVCTDATRSITLTHLSEMNNAPHLAESTVLFVNRWSVRRRHKYLGTRWTSFFTFHRSSRRGWFCNQRNPKNSSRITLNQ